MKVLFRILGAIGCAFGALTMFYAFPFTLATKSINPQIIDSGIDKLFFAFMVLGCGVCYALASYCLFRNLKLVENKRIMYAGMVGCFAFMAGLYYHMIFQSPW